MDLLKRLVDKHNKNKTKFFKGLIKRDLDRQLRDSIKNKKNLIIEGLRGVGKTYYIINLLNALKRDYYYIDVEDIYERIDEKDLRNLIKQNKNKLWVIDNAHLLNNINFNVKQLILISSVKKDIKEFERFRFFPLSFKEIYGVPKNQEEGKRLFDKYVKRALIKNKDKIINKIYLDIVRVFKVNNKIIKDLMYFLIDNYNNDLITTRINKRIKGVNYYNIKRYTQFLQDTFFIEISYKQTLRNKDSSYKKYYFGSHCFIERDKDKRISNIAALELLRRKYPLYYYVNDNNRDFFVEFATGNFGRVEFLININFNDKEIDHNKVKAILEGKRLFKNDNLIILTQNFEAYNEYYKWFSFRGYINFVPLWKWLIKDEM